MREILTESGMKINLGHMWMTSGLWSLFFLLVGEWRWEEKRKKFEFKKEWEEEDISLKESDTVRMAKETNKAMNSIYPFLKFTV